MFFSSAAIASRACVIGGVSIEHGVDDAGVEHCLRVVEESDAGEVLFGFRADVGVVVADGRRLERRDAPRHRQQAGARKP